MCWHWRFPINGKHFNDVIRPSLKFFSFLQDRNLCSLDCVEWRADIVRVFDRFELAYTVEAYTLDRVAVVSKYGFRVLPGPRRDFAMYIRGTAIYKRWQGNQRIWGILWHHHRCWCQFCSIEKVRFDVLRFALFILQPQIGPKCLLNIYDTLYILSTINAWMAWCQFYPRCRWTSN